jgi:prepilin-type N-terminal cleavage/methylation domain-containing protein
LEDQENTDKVHWVRAGKKMKLTGIKKQTGRRAGKKSQAGFTLMEMVLVATLIAILSTMAISSMSMARYKAMETGAAQALKALAQAEEMYQIDNGRYALSFSSLANTYLPRAYSVDDAYNVFAKNYSLYWIHFGRGGPRPPITNYSSLGYTIYAIPIDHRLKTFVITDGGTVQVANTLTNWSPY